MIDAILTNAVLPEISRELLARLSADRVTRTASIAVSRGEFAYELA
jgi:hypothetical protein